MTRLAIVGCGGMAEAHAGLASRLRDRLQVTATVDVDPVRAERLRSMTGAARACADVLAALDAFDAALVALPHHLHHPVGMALLRAGKHVLMEKPLANTEEQCRELIEAAERGGRTLMVGYCQRYHPLCVRLQTMLGDGAIGTPFHASLWTEQHTEVGPDSWVARADLLGGGQLFSHGCHYIDLMLAWLGDPVEGAHLGTNLGTPWMEREGTSDVVIRFASGALAYHGATWGARGTRLGYAFHVHGDRGMLELDQGRGALLLHREGRVETVAEDAGPAKHLDRQMAHFLDCVERGERPLTDGRRSLQSLRVIWRLTEAERAGRFADLRGLGLSDA